MKTFLELESPAFTCGHCRFTTALTGHWVIEHNRLVFRAERDPQPRRGPDLRSCCESRVIAEFDRIITDTGQEFGEDYLNELRLETDDH